MIQQIVHQPIVDACDGCPKIFDFAPPGGMIIYEACRAYADPAVIQNRMGKTDACALKPIKEPEKKSTPQLKRKFGKRTR